MSSTLGSVQKVFSPLLRSRSLIDATVPSTSQTLHHANSKQTITARGLYISQSNPLRCIESLKKEHMIMTSTMRAFSQFVHRMDSDLQAIEHADHENTAQREEICAKYMNDWNAFIQFADQFNTKHHRKEEVLYNEAEKQIADEKHVHYAMIQNVNDEHYYEHKLYQLIAQRLKIDDQGNEEQFAQNIDNIVSSAKLLTDLLFKHIVLENDVVYPRITKQLLNTRQMEHISQELDEYDRENREVVKEMEFLSQGLVRKFNRKVEPVSMC